MNYIEQSYQSWGNMNSKDRETSDLAEFSNHNNSHTFLPYGNGRSYGDSCLNDHGKLLPMQANAKIHHFDPLTGILKADAGVLLHDILKRVIPYGYFLEVTPGTSYVTLGGAIANDVHGKNHHKRGTFGRSILSFELVRSDRHVPVQCSSSNNKKLFRATIGGLGLTGVITNVRMKLMKVSSIDILQKSVRFNHLNEYFELVDEIDNEHEYSVAWLDQLLGGSSLGRGVLLAGNHATDTDIRPAFPKPAKFKVPFTPPISLINKVSLSAFNSAYFYKHKRGIHEEIVPWQSYFYPLDSIAGWNKLYGLKGLMQHQSVFPKMGAVETTTELLNCAKRHGHASFLTVLKRFGDISSPGLISFPKEGFTLTLDFSNQGEKTHALLNELDAIVLAAGGAVNPYKDARMKAPTFKKSFAKWQDLEALRDPKINSDFWRRTVLSD